MKHCAAISTKAVKILALAALVLLLPLILFACGADGDENLDALITVSGQITADGEPLRNVTVLNCGEDFFPAVFTNQNGIFVATGLKEGDILSFRRHGFIFSPENYFVLSNETDLRITAQAVPDNIEEGGDNGNEGDGDPQFFTVEIISEKPSLVDTAGGTFEHGAQIELSAREEDGARFSGWFIEDSLLSSFLDYSYAVTADTTIEARFLDVPLSPQLQWSAQLSVLSWQAVQSAASYKVYIGSELFVQTENTSVSLADALLLGENEIAVEAVGSAELVSHPARLAIYLNPRISSAKSIGFLQNGGEKHLVFALGQDADGFMLRVGKNHAEWSAHVNLSDVAAHPNSSSVVLSLNPQAHAAFSLEFFVWRQTQEIDGESLTVVSVKFDDMFGADGQIAELLSFCDSPDFPQSLSGFLLAGIYDFGITATTSSENFRDSLQESASFEHEVRLSAPANLAFSDGILSFFFDMDSIGTIVENLFFELFINNVKVAEITAAGCELSPELQTQNETNQIVLSDYFSGNTGDITSLSLIASAPDFLSSPPAAPWLA